MDDGYDGLTRDSDGDRNSARGSGVVYSPRSEKSDTVRHRTRVEELNVNLDNELDRLDSQIKQLFDKIGVILIPQAENESDCDNLRSHEQRVQSDLANTIESFIWRINDLSNAIGRVIDRVDV